jgi:hypothetical protein
LEIFLLTDGIGIGQLSFFGVVLFGAGVAYELAGKRAKRGVIRGFVLFLEEFEFIL